MGRGGRERGESESAPSRPVASSVTMRIQISEI